MLFIRILAEKSGSLQKISKLIFMIRSSLVFLFLVFQFCAFAQPAQKGLIVGTVVDSVTLNTLPAATVSVFSPVSGELLVQSTTNSEGKLSVANLNYGTYELVINFLGYNTMVLESVSVNAPQVDLGQLSLSLSSNVIGEVVVEGERPVIENKIDRLVYHAERDVTSFGGNATDVLRKVPLISVDVDGNVSLRGDSQVRILINGKPSGAMSGSVGEALKMIPADQISNVEVITSPSAKYDGEGTSGIINIITKKQITTGVNGSVTAGIGTRQNSTNVNLNSRTGRLGVVANGGANWMWPQVTESSFVQKDLQGNTQFSQLAENNTTRAGGRGTIGVDYDWNPKNLFNTTFNYNAFDMNFDGASTAFLQNASELKSESVQKTGMDGFDWSAGYTRKFDREKQEFSLATQFSRSNSRTDYTTEYLGLSANNELGVNSGQNDEYTVMADYAQPLSERALLEVGAKVILRDIQSEVELRDYRGGQLGVNPNRSYVFDYEQDVAAAYGSLNMNLTPTVQMIAGLRAEQTMIKASAAGDSSPTENRYLSVLPNAVISKTIGRMSNLKFSYNQRIQRPSMFYLNPFRNTADPINQSEGNPNLKPEKAHNFEAAYSTFHNGLVFSSSLYYRVTNDVIESFFTNLENLDQHNSNNQTIVLMTYDNIGTQKSLGTNLFASYSPITPLKLSSNVNLYSYEVNPNSNIDDHLSAKGGKTYLMYRVFANASYTISPGFQAESFIILNAPRRTFQGTMPHFSMWSLGLKKEILNKTANIGITILDPFTEVKTFDTKVYTADYVQRSSFAVPFRSFGINFSWNFGKLNMKDAPRKDRGIVNEDLKVEEPTN